MVDWSKNRSVIDKLLIDHFFVRKTKLFKYLTTKLFRERIRNVEDYGIKDLTVFCVANSHLDSAWRWRKSDTRERKIYATFSRNIYHLTEEPFSMYKFVANAAIHYDWIKEDYPELFQAIKDQVRQNRWEVVGGEWVEQDCNIPSGESHVRQRLIGQRFNIREFGDLTHYAWMDDVFGWPGSLPQILAKSGATHFYTNKFCYSHFSYVYPPESPDYAGEEKFPFLHFWWQSPDGSRVLVSWAQHKNNIHQHLKQFTKHSRTVKSLSENLFNYQMNWAEINAKCSDEVVPWIIDAYGQGDGGMGPNSLEIMEKMVWEQDSPYGVVNVQNGNLSEYFNHLRPYQDRFPIWQDELYLENHRGTLTSVGMIKENNHTAEVLLNETETVSLISGLLGAEHFQEELLEDWKIVLFLQFHDVLPGSSIAEVYRDAASDYNSVFAHLFSTLEASLMHIAHSSKLSIKNNLLSVFNPVSWPRHGYLTLFARQYNSALDSENAPLICQRVSFTNHVSNREVQLGFNNVPGTNYLRNSNGLQELEDYLYQPKDKLLIYLPSSSKLGGIGLDNLLLLESPSKPMNMQKFAISEDIITFQNRKIFVEISLKTGRIVTLKSSKDTPNLLTQDGIGYNLYQDDKTQFDAWNIDLHYHDKLQEFPPLMGFEIEEEGPLRYTILMRHQPTLAGSLFYTRLSFYHNSSKIYGETIVNWQEEWKLLKIGVHSAFNNREVHCGNPFGVQVRSTNPTTVYQKAMIEFAYQEYAYWKDLGMAKGDYDGFAFYSQSKFGMSTNQGTCEFTLLKAPKFEKPDHKYATLDDDFETRSKTVDVGFHHIPWALDPLKPGQDRMFVIKEAREYNMPMIAVPSGVEHEALTFFELNSENVILESIKEGEEFMRDAPDWFYKPQMSEVPFILRCVEYTGESASCTIQCDQNLDLKKVIEVDLLERINNNGINESDVKLDGRNITFSIKPFEIKSLLVVARIPLEDK